MGAGKEGRHNDRPEVTGFDSSVINRFFISLLPLILIFSHSGLY